MFAGHFGLAAAVKAKAPKVPLWAIMTSTQLLDIAFVPLFIKGIEPIETIAGGGYGNAIIHADYTHSLVGALLIAVLAGLAASLAWGKQGAWVISSVVFSHWILDLLVHRADLPIFPGNAFDLPLLGLGMWKWPFASVIAELLILVIGFVMYARSLQRRSGNIGNKTKVWIASGVMALLLILSLVTDFFGTGV
ncbi:hypothetical protein [Paenibacillus beijingensis]|uniref:Permease n=1 Tax=Paenibacillus beijingensis TaxID=1126833 RepID=A0A0D5NF11_9BACL|nr:hypothetical protein [Paenibacillus beijingensis]AJY73826.1 permease [Paenibacillus beijingensis]